MKITKSILSMTALLLLVSCSGDKSKQWDPEKDRKQGMGIILTPNTSLRIDPLIFSSRVDQMKKGDIVEILDRSKEVKYIGNTKNYWYKIKLKNGIIGWTYGEHLKVLDGSNRSDIDKYLEKFWEKETETLRTALHGKWWSVNRFGDFTSHSLEIYRDGKYKSYLKQSQKKIKGDYTFNFNDNSIVFSEGTSFKDNLRFFKRGSLYVLAKESEKGEIMFKKINIDPQTDDEKEAEKKEKEQKKAPKEKKDKNGSKTQ